MRVPATASSPMSFEGLRGFGPVGAAGKLGLRLLALLGAALLLAGCEKVERAAGTRDALALYEPRARIHWISRDLSLEFGAFGYAQEIESLAAEKRINTDERLRRRANAIATRIVQQAVAIYPFSAAWDWDLTIVDSEEINASCRSGGKMMVNRGLLDNPAFDDHKVATILGHEVAHALLEHGRSSIGRSAFTGSALYVMGQSFKMGQLRLASVMGGMEKVTLPLEREQEREADLLGMELMVRAGFDPVRGVAFWRDASAADSASTLERRLEMYASSHPTSQERLATLSKVAAQLAAATGARR